MIEINFNGVNLPFEWLNIESEQKGILQGVAKYIWMCARACITHHSAYHLLNILTCHLTHYQTCDLLGYHAQDICYWDTWHLYEFLWIYIYA